MTTVELMDLIASGEDSGTLFMVDVRDAESLATEMAAFANILGGQILLGVNERGNATGLDPEHIQGINQQIETAASRIRRPLTVHTENLLLENDRVVIVLTIPEGVDKPYFDTTGVIWLKNGADKRQVNSTEEFRLLSQSFDSFLADDPTIPCENDPVESQSEPVESEDEPVDGQNEPVEAENDPVEYDVSPLQSQLVNLIRSNPDITYNEMSEAVGKSRSTVGRNMGRLRDQGLVRRIGSARHGHWEILE